MALYFAYGSNLLTSRLRHRCPSARPVGTATAHGFEVVFCKRGRDGSGKASVARSAAAAEGVLYTMTPADLRLLDALEGPGYRRDDAFVVTHGTRSVTATTYIARAPEDGLIPFDWYLALMMAGAAEHGLAPPWRQTEWVEDPMPSRTGRRDALRALEAAGHGLTWRDLIQGDG